MAEAGQRGAVALGEADAIEEDRRGAARFERRPGLAHRLGRGGVGTGGGEDRRPGEPAPFAALGFDLPGDRHDDAELAALDEAGDHARDDVVGLDQPGLVAMEPVKGPGTQQEDHVAALGFESGERALHAVAHARPRQLDRAAIVQPGDQRRLAGFGPVARVDLARATGRRARRDGPGGPKRAHGGR